MSFKIEKGIPIPAIERVERKRKYPLDTMAIGESFFVPGTKASSMHACITRFHKATKGKKDQGSKKFCVRTVTEDGVAGARVWRTE